jgi:hypothetical protein
VPVFREELTRRAESARTEQNGALPSVMLHGRCHRGAPQFVLFNPETGCARLVCGVCKRAIMDMKIASETEGSILCQSAPLILPN